MAHTDQEEIERLKSRMLMKSYYVMFRSVLDRSKLSGAALDHYRWIIALEKQGRVFASGPLFEADGSQGAGMTVLRANSAEEACALAAGDPFCIAGGVDFVIRRWQLNEGRLQFHLDLSDQSYSLA
jgi:uncharacterized protein YciI